MFIGLSYFSQRDFTAIKIHYAQHEHYQRGDLQ
jgi:hypothetical protein